MSGPMSSRASKLRLSLASPPVRRNAIGWPSKSVLRWILGEKPPRELPRPAETLDRDLPVSLRHPCQHGRPSCSRPPMNHRRTDLGIHKPSSCDNPSTRPRVILTFRFLLITEGDLPSRRVLDGSWRSWV